MQLAGRLTRALDGLAAAAAFPRLASGAVVEAGAVQELRGQLLAYCERDTP